MYEQNSYSYSEDENEIDYNEGEEDEQDGSDRDEMRHAFTHTHATEAELDRSDHEENTHVYYHEHAERGEAYHGAGDLGDLEEVNESSRFVNYKEETLIKDEIHGVYYQGRSIGSVIIVSTCLAMTILVFLTGFLSAFWSKPNKSSTAQHTLRPTLKPTLKPSLSPTTSSPITNPPSPNPTRNVPALDQAIGRLTGQTQRTSRSQEQAFDWIVDEDPLQLASEDPGLAQRFILATMYFSAASWSGEAWLANSTTCGWAGVDCDETGQVSHLNLSTLQIVINVGQFV